MAYSHRRHAVFKKLKGDNMDNRLPPYPSMTEMIEADYNKRYERWKRDFYHDNMTDTPPITIGHVMFKTYETHESAVIRYLVTALILIAIIFWLIPALYYHGNPVEMDKIGTMEAVEDILTRRELNGVFVRENGKWREATEDEIDYYMETGACGGGNVCVD